MKRLPFFSTLLGLGLLPAAALAQTSWLAAGAGDGFAAFPVGPFGEISGINGDVGTWDPVGAEPNKGTAYNTFLVVSDRAVSPSSPVGHALYQPYEFATYNILGLQPAASVNLVQVSSSPTSRVTTFDLPAFPGLSVTLTQVATTATLTQTYVFNNAGPTRTLTLSRFSDIDMEQGGGAYTDDWGFYDAVNTPLEVTISDVTQSYRVRSALGGAVTPEGARVYMRLANAGGGAHDRVPVSANLGHPASRLIFEACVYGAQASYGDCGVLIDNDGDGVTDMTGDLGVTIQGFLTVPGGGSATAIVTLDYTSPCADTDADGACDTSDNCLGTWNPSQNDSDANGLGDACDPVCTTVQEGLLGTVPDAYVSSSAPTTNYGTGTSLACGTAYRSYLQPGPITAPAGAVITQATLGLMQISGVGSGTVIARAVLTPWSESTLTYNTRPPTTSTVDGSGTFPGGTGPTSVDLTALVQAWVSGAQPNYGVFLAGAAVFASSEASAVSSRPSLQYCYVIPG